MAVTSASQSPSLSKSEKAAPRQTRACWKKGPEPADASENRPAGPCRRSWDVCACPFRGLPGWGAKSTAAVLSKFKRLESIPEDWREWRVNASSAATLAATFKRDRDLAFLFRDLATLRTDIPVFDSIDELEWKGPTDRFPAIAATFDAAKAQKKP